MATHWRLPDPEITRARLADALAGTDAEATANALASGLAAAEVDEPDGERVAWHAAATRDLYTALRGPLPDRNHYWLLLAPDPEADGLITRAARLVRAAVEVACAVADGTLAPDVLDGAPLEMRQYARGVFGTARLPGETRDTVRHWPLAEHIAVICEGRVHTLPVVIGGRPASAQAVADALAPLVAADRPTPLPGSVPVATSLPRATWAALRRTLDPAALERVDGALFALCLEPGFAPADDAAAAEALRRGDVSGRWFDKSLQVVVFADGAAGLSWEHAAVDGHVAMCFADRLAPPAWDPTTPGEAIAVAAIDFGDDADLRSRVAVELVGLDPDTVPEGRSLLTAFGRHRLGIDRRGADAMVQLAITRAARMTLGGWPPINEAVQVRHWIDGRYDTALTVTPAQRHAIEAWERLGAPDAITLRAVGAAHRARITACRQGDSPVLPWLVHCAAAGQPALADVVDCPVTTSCGGHSPQVRFFGFTDAAVGAIGVSYLLGPDTLALHVKSDGRRRALLDAFVGYLRAGLNAIAAVEVA